MDCSTNIGSWYVYTEELHVWFLEVLRYPQIIEWGHYRGRGRSSVGAQYVLTVYMSVWLLWSNRPWKCKPNPHSPGRKELSVLRSEACGLDIIRCRWMGEGKKAGLRHLNALQGELVGTLKFYFHVVAAPVKPE